jgi:hypothetical protein
MKLKTILAVLAIQVMSSSAFAVDLSGSHQGHIAQDKNQLIDFLVKKIAGSEGSYFAVLIQREKDFWFQGFNPNKIGIYKVEPLDSENSFTMVPFVVTPDGSVGVNNADPSLVLNITGNTGSVTEFTIASANSSNRFGIQSSIIFEKGERSDLTWIPLEGGKFELDGDGTKIATTVSNLDSNFEATTSFMTKKDLNGDFIIQEKQPGIYVLKTRTVTSTGVEAEHNPKRVGVMIHQANTMSRDDKYLVFVDASFVSVITRLEMKH